MLYTKRGAPCSKPRLPAWGAAHTCLSGPITSQEFGVENIPRCKGSHPRRRWGFSFILMLLSQIDQGEWRIKAEWGLQVNQCPEIKVFNRHPWTGYSLLPIASQRQPQSAPQVSEGLVRCCLACLDLENISV